MMRVLCLTRILKDLSGNHRVEKWRNSQKLDYIRYFSRFFDFSPKYI